MISDRDCLKNLSAIATTKFNAIKYLNVKINHPNNHNDIIRLFQ